MNTWGMAMKMNNTWRGTYEYLGHGDEHEKYQERNI
jgi:hypothetical protein